MVLVVMNLSACAGGGSGMGLMTADQPKEETFRTQLPRELSNFNVVAEATERELSDTLNRLTPRELYRGASRDSGLSVTMLRNGPIQVRAADNFIYLSVPVSVSLQYGIFETRPMATRLAFKLSARVTPDWKIVTEVYYTGLSDLFAGDLHIGPLAIKPRSIVEGVTEPVQRMFAGLIDRRLNERFPLRPAVAKVWAAVQKPLLVDKRYDAWLALTPQGVVLYPLYAQQGLVRLGVGVTTFAELVVGPEPKAHPPTPLPNLRLATGTDRAFRVALNTDLVYKDLVTVAAPLLLNRQFASDGKQIVIKDISLYGNGDRLVIRLETRGSLDGVIYLTCRPVFNPHTNIFSVEDVDFDLQTRSMLLKTADWLLHGTIRSVIQEKLNMDLTQRLTQVRDMASQAMARVPLGGNLFLTGTVRAIKLQDVLVQKDRLSIQVYAEGESGIVLR